MMYHGSSIKTWLCLLLKSEHTSKPSGRTVGEKVFEKEKKGKKIRKGQQRDG